MQNHRAHASLRALPRISHVRSCRYRVDVRDRGCRWVTSITEREPMAKTKTEKGQKSRLPDGFVPLQQSRVAGFFICEEGNAVQGFIRDTFQTPNRFKPSEPKTVFKIEVSTPGTRIIDGENGEREAEIGELIGLDEKGYLRKLRDVEKGREIAAICTGQEAKPAKKGQSPAWIFEIGVMPF